MRSNYPSQMTVLTTLKVGAHHTLAPMIIPPDGGWGWVIVFTGFTASVIMDGISYCFFLFREPMSGDLKVPSSEISFLSALFTGFYFLGGILACSAGNHFGFRPIMIVGATTVVIALSSGYFLSNMQYFLIIVGVIGGIAAGFIFVAGALPVGFYFDKKRSIAIGLVNSGSGVGAAIMPQAAQYFMSHFGWRYTFLFLASLCLVLILMGFFIRPLRPVMVVMKQGSRLSLLTLHERGGSSPIDLSLFRFPAVETDSIDNSSNIANMPQTHPTIEQMAHEMDMISIRVPDNTERSMLLKLSVLTQSRLLQPSVSMVATPIIVEKEEPLPYTKLPWYKCQCCCGQPALPERPLLRTDLYYTGSLTRLDEYTTKDTGVEYHMHVTKVPTYFETMQDLTRKYTIWCCRNLLHGLRTLLDYTLLKSPVFICLALCGFANYLAFFLPFLYGKVHLENIGQGQHAVNLVSMIGIGNMIGRMSSGIIMSKMPKFGARTVASTTCFLSGVAVICCTFYGELIYQFAMILLYGTVVGFYAPLRSLIIVDFFGLNRLTSATGMMILFQGLGSFLGAPLAESILIATKMDNSPYYLCGGSLVFASMILWPMRILQKWEKKIKEKRKR